MVDILADALNTIKTHEIAGRKECVVKASKFIKNVLSILKEKGYIRDFELIEDGRGNKFRVVLCGKINDTGVIKPRFPVKKEELTKYEQLYLPAYNVGVIIISTSQGLLTNEDAHKKGIGGRLIAYVY